MKNPFITKLNNNKEHAIGDPYIMRFNGKYYLYPSSLYEEEGVRVFVSDDLVHFEDKGFVVEDKRLKCAYAPEVIYHNGDFYMCTSPLGNGHYLLKSKSPLGPFEFISDNVQNMIDGSFALDEDFNLRFLRADHHGIAMLYVENEKELVRRKNILPPISEGWTEGPSCIYRNGYYFATYCGNFLTATSYRIKAASSRLIDQDYVTQDEPLLISTKKGFACLGHNSMVLGPNLDQYYIAYHNLNENKDGSHFRYLNLDPIHFNGRHMSVNPCDKEQSNPEQPIFIHSDEHKTLKQSDGYYLSSIATKKKYTVEFNFEGNNSLLIGYKNENNFYEIKCDNNEVSLIRTVKGVKRLIEKKTISINFEYFHSVRVINDEYLEILIDNVPVIRQKAISLGRIGYLSLKGVHYTAFSNYANGNSEKNEPIFAPGTIEANNTQSNVIYQYINEVNCADLSMKDKARYKVFSKRGKYLLFINLHYKSDAKIRITSKNEAKELLISSKQKEYEFAPYPLGEFDLSKNDFIQIEVLEGNLMFNKLLVREKSSLNKTKYQDIEFANCSSKQEVEFIYQEFTRNSLFGIVINASNHSIHPCNKEPSYMGYLVGFRNDLLVVEHVQYGCERVYDKPVPIELDKQYKLTTLLEKSVLSVYLNDEKLFETTLTSDDVSGLGGYFKNPEAKVTLKYKKEEE